MPITINGNGTVTGISVGGLPDGIVDTDTLATDAVTNAKVANDAINTNEIVNSAVTSAKASGLGGVTEIDQWLVTSDSTGDQEPITTWARDADSRRNWAAKGTGMSHSSGIFTFPSTGYWRIHFHFMRRMGDPDVNNSYNIYVDPGTGSYVHMSETWGSPHFDSTNRHHNTDTEVNIRVPNASTWHVKFVTDHVDDNEKLYGSTDVTKSYATFIKLGDL